MRSGTVPDIAEALTIRNYRRVATFVVTSGGSSSATTQNARGRRDNALALIPASAAVVPANAEEACSTTVINSPDGSALTILFDDLSVAGGPQSRACTISTPLDLPQGYSLGVYRVDYRGYAHLAKKENATLVVDYNRGGSVCLNSYWGFAKWISALVMPLPGLASAH